MISEERMRKFMKKRMIAIAMIFAAGVIPMAVPVHASAPQTMGMELTMNGYQAVTADDNSTEADESTDLVVPGLGSWLYEKDDTNHILYLTKYTGKDERIRVPATYEVDGQKYAVRIKNKVSGISEANGVFVNNRILKEVEFEDGVGGDFKGTFDFCTSLEKANIPKGASDCSYMFSFCYNLKEVSEIPEGVTNCTCMFSYCRSLLKAPEIPQSVTECTEMFEDCASIIEAPVIPEGVKDCTYMFAYCNKLLKASEIPEGVTDCSGMFYECQNLLNASDIPASVKDASGMFYNCKKITGNMRIYGKIDKLRKDNLWRGEAMFEQAATSSDGLIIQYAKGVNIDEILATKSETSKITAIQLPDEPVPTPDEPKPTPDNPTPGTPAPSGTKVATYNGDTFYKGNDGELRCYDSDGKLVTDEFKCDGTYTYYMQADGTPMKDRLTYHPDGEHIIYLDENGHEAFTNFVYCPSVGYICYFDSNGYLYKDQITFVGDKTYYLNGNGALEQNGWFQFANGLDYGFANSDGTLVTTGFSYDPYGRVVFYHWNGMVARGLISDGVYYYSMDETDGHYLGQFPVQ